MNQRSAEAVKQWTQKPKNPISAIPISQREKSFSVSHFILFKLSTRFRREENLAMIRGVGGIPGGRISLGSCWISAACCSLQTRWRSQTDKVGRDKAGVWTVVQGQALTTSLPPWADQPRLRATSYNSLQYALPSKLSDAALCPP